MGIFGFTKGQAPVSVNEEKVQALLSRGTENVIPRDLAQKKLTGGEKLRIYWGIDPTGARIHLGHAVPLRKMKQFTDLGHHVIFLVGSFTATIGDPTGRDAAREPLTQAQVEENFQTYKQQAEKILDFSKVEVRYNHEWLAKLTFEDIIGLASKFTVQQMLQRDMFERRLKEGKPVSLHEFLYPLMVGYDSVVLDVDCELGGSDQEFNMLAGRHLQSAFGKRDKFVLTCKLLEGLDGRKMSKSFNNCVYLNDTPADMYGKIMSLKDELVADYFEVATDVPQGEVETIIAGHPKEAKMRLAREIVTMYHSDKQAQEAEETFKKTFSDGEFPSNARKVRLSEFQTMRAFVAAIADVSNSEATRLFEQGAVRNEKGEKMTDPHAPPVLGKYRVGSRQFGEIVE